MKTTIPYLAKRATSDDENENDEDGGRSILDPSLSSGEERKKPGSLKRIAAHTRPAPANKRHSVPRGFRAAGTGEAGGGADVARTPRGLVRVSRTTRIVRMKRNKRYRTQRWTKRDAERRRGQPRYSGADPRRESESRHGTDESFAGRADLMPPGFPSPPTRRAAAPTFRAG